MTMECKNLWMTIHKLEFTLIELMLYLDTHKCDTKALCEYQKIQHLYNDSLAVYEKTYGPIFFNQVHSENVFTWAETPMPWEMEVYA